MDIAETDDIVDVRLVALRGQGIAEKDDKVDFIVLDLRTDLLLPSEMSGEIFVNAQVSDFLNKPAGRSGSIKLMPAPGV